MPKLKRVLVGILAAAVLAVTALIAAPATSHAATFGSYRCLWVELYKTPWGVPKWGFLCRQIGSGGGM